jgi:molybdopterin/thiamine biosynthesis adenylyltransferase
MIDPIRHITVFNPDTFRGRIDVIGLGATGGRVGLTLAKLGIEDDQIHGWDYDLVGSENISNQIFGNIHIGQPKALAASQLIRELTGTRIVAHEEELDGTQVLGDVVFLLTDTMQSRKRIWDGSLRYTFRTRLVIETRLGAEAGMVFAVDPNNPEQVREWESTLTSDDEAEVSACGGKISIGPTADILAGFAVWEFIRWHQRQLDPDAERPRHIGFTFSLRPLLLMSHELVAA